MRFRKSFVSGQYLCLFFSSFSTFAKKIVFAYFVSFFSRSLSNGRFCERCIGAWCYVFQLVVRLCYDFFKLKHLFLIISSG